MYCAKGVLLCSSKLNSLHINMTNLPDPPKSIKYNLNDPEKQRCVNILSGRTEFKELITHREQCYYLYVESDLLKIKKITKYSLSYDDIGKLFGISGSTARFHINNYKKELEDEILKNGRPFSLTETEITDVKSWIQSNESPPKLRVLKSYIQNSFGKTIFYSSLQILLQRMGYACVTAKPIEEKRYDVKNDDIVQFFKELKELEELRIPTFLTFNLDEEGHDSYVDSIEAKIIVPQEKVKTDQHGEFFYPVDRKSNHTTFLACVTAAGQSLKPMIVTKRKTIEELLFLKQYDNSKLYLAYSNKGYITSELFNEWAQNVFEPFIRSIRDEKCYSGPGLLILDGCSSHNTSYFKEICQRNNIIVKYLPPHSSNQLQPLDLSIFHSHKNTIRNLIIESGSEESDLVIKIITLIDAWTSTCRTSVITSGFTAMGASFHFDPQSPLNHQTYITFDINDAERLLNQKMTTEEKQKKRERMVTEGKKRISIWDFNQKFFKVPSVEFLGEVLQSTTESEPQHAQGVNREESSNSQPSTPQRFQGVNREESSNSQPSTSVPYQGSNSAVISGAQPSTSVP